jgi:hypothetical protein
MRRHRLAAAVWAELVTAALPAKRIPRSSCASARGTKPIRSRRHAPHRRQLATDRHAQDVEVRGVHVAGFRAASVKQTAPPAPSWGLLSNGAKVANNASSKRD